MRPYARGSFLIENRGFLLENRGFLVENWGLREAEGETRCIDKMALMCYNHRYFKEGKI